MTGGCQGFATKYLDWPEELIVGETIKNRSGIIRRFAFLSDRVVKEKLGKCKFATNFNIIHWCILMLERSSL